MRYSSGSKITNGQDQDHKISGFSIMQVLQSLFHNVLDWYTTNEYVPNKQRKESYVVKCFAFPCILNSIAMLSDVPQVWKD